MIMILMINDFCADCITIQYIYSILYIIYILLLYYIYMCVCVVHVFYIVIILLYIYICNHDSPLDLGVISLFVGKSLWMDQKE